MLWPESDSDQPGRDRAKKRETRQEAKNKRRRKRLGRIQYAADDTILEKKLQPLRHDRRPRAPLLNPMQIRDCQPALS